MTALQGRLPAIGHPAWVLKMEPPAGFGPAQLPSEGRTLPLRYGGVL